MCLISVLSFLSLRLELLTTCNDLKETELISSILSFHVVEEG